MPSFKGFPEERTITRAIAGPPISVKRHLGRALERAELIMLLYTRCATGISDKISCICSTSGPFRLILSIGAERSISKCFMRSARISWRSWPGNARAQSSFNKSLISLLLTGPC